MQANDLYPLRFDPIYQYRPWGGRRLEGLLSAPLPGEEPIGEVWLLSDRDDHPSRVADGPLRDRTIAELTAESPDALLGDLVGRFSRFPLLLKLLDVNQALSVQVHPPVGYTGKMPVGETAKTEAWVVLESGVSARVFAGFRAHTSAAHLRQAIADGTIAQELAQFAPLPGDAVLIRAGTIHSLSDVVVFEIQQNSDVTFRLYDWDHIDPKTLEPRPLQLEEALACIDFDAGAVTRLAPRTLERRPVLREALIHCNEFGATRITGRLPFVIGRAGTPRVLMCLEGMGQLEYAGRSYRFATGQVLLVPAVVGECLCRPLETVSVLEITLPDFAGP